MDLMATQGKLRTPHPLTRPLPQFNRSSEFTENHKKPHPKTILDASQRSIRSRKTLSTWINAFQALHRLLIIHIQAPFPQLSLYGFLSGFMILLVKRPYYRVITGMWIYDHFKPVLINNGTRQRARTVDSPHLRWAE